MNGGILKKGDCILMKGTTINEPITLYYVTDMTDAKIHCLRVYIHDNMVQGMDFASEYDYDIPKEAILLPEGTYQRVKESMKRFVMETETFLRTNCNNGCFKVKVGGHYLERYLETITDIEGNRTKYRLFRIESENISPCWSGEGFVDNLEEYGIEVSDEVFNDLVQRYRKYVKDLKESILQVSKMKRSESDSLKLAQEYVISKGYKGELRYLKQWKGCAVYEIKGLPDDDFGEPLVVTVTSSGDCQIKSYFKVLS